MSAAVCTSVAVQRAHAAGRTKAADSRGTSSALAAGHVRRRDTACDGRRGTEAAAPAGLPGAGRLTSAGRQAAGRCPTERRPAPATLPAQLPTSPAAPPAQLPTSPAAPPALLPTSPAAPPITHVPRDDADAADSADHAGDLVRSAMPAIWYISYAATAARNRAAGPMRVVGPGLREAGPPAEVAAPKAGRDAAAAAPRGSPREGRARRGRSIIDAGSVVSLRP